MNNVAFHDSERKRCMTEEEEALEEERKKNLSILQSVLDSSQQICCSKMASKARTFRSSTHSCMHVQSLKHSRLSNEMFSI